MATVQQLPAMSLPLRAPVTPAPSPTRSLPPSLVPVDPPRSPLLNALTDMVGWLAERPWLAALAAAGVVTAQVAAAGLWRWRHRRLVRHAQQILLTPPPEVDPAGAAAWWANLTELLTPSRWRRLLYGTPHVAVEYRWAGRELTIVVWVPGVVPAGPVAAAIRAAWPGAATTITEATAPLPAGPLPGRALAAGGALVAARPAWYPLRTDQDTHPTRALVAAGSGLHHQERACVQILARPATPRQVSRLRAGAAALRTGRPPARLADPIGWLRGGLNVVEELAHPTRTATRGGNTGHRPALTDPLRERDARAGVDKTLGPQWDVAVRFAVAHTDPGNADRSIIQRRLVTVAHGLASAYGAYTAGNRLRRIRLPHPVAVLAGRPLRRGFLLSAAELAAVAALPVDLAVPGLDRARAKASPAPVVIPGGGRGVKVLGRAEVGGHSVGLSVVDARQHIHLLGATGSGKSTLMCHLILDDIRAGRGVVVIDPKGDLAVDVLDRLPATVADRVVLIDPDQPHGATLNPLVGVDHDLVVDNVVSIFAKIFQRHWGPRIDDVLRVACLTLMRHPKPTLANVPPLLNDKQFRASFTVGLDDPEGLKGFWEWFESTPPPLRAQVIGPVLARLRSFLLRDFVRRTIGPAESSFDMGRVLDRGGILIARLPKGQLGEDTAKLLGSFVFASVWQAATARARTPESARRDATVYVDEAHNVLNLAGSVGDMLAEARGYRLSLVLAHQNLTQLPRESQLALSANARNKLYFTCSPEDARQLALHTVPELDEHDLSHLGAYTVAARLVAGNRETAAFTLRGKPPREPLGETAVIRRAAARPETAATRPAESEPAEPGSRAGDRPAPAGTTPQVVVGRDPGRSPR